MPHPPDDVATVFEAVAAAVEPWLGAHATGRDLARGWRVLHTATELAESYPEADGEGPGAAALGHDVHRAMGAEAGEYVHPEDSLEEVEAVLEAADFPPEKREAVLRCVALHDEYDFRGDRREASVRASSEGRSASLGPCEWAGGPRADGDAGTASREAGRIEADLLRDAADLDAMGAEGVARCFAYSGAHGRPLWTPGGEDASAVDHFHEKLLELRGEMHTDAAREVAEGRHAFLEAFLERFEAEWYGRS